MKVNYHSTMQKIIIKPFIDKETVDSVQQILQTCTKWGQVKIIMVSSFVEVEIIHMEDTYGIHPENIGRLFTVVIINIKVKKVEQYEQCEKQR